MATTTSPGIDYGRGITNIDLKTGIRYGVIHQNEVLQTWADSAEAEYGEPTCPECGSEVAESTPAKGRDFYCRKCHHVFWSDACYPDEPDAFTLDDGEYLCEQSGSDCDIFILKSPYFTVCQLCSPCAPGAGYLMNTLETDTPAAYRTYAFGHDWFEDGRAPYPVYSVATGKLVEPE